MDPLLLLVLSLVVLLILQYVTYTLRQLDMVYMS